MKPQQEMLMQALRILECVLAQGGVMTLCDINESASLIKEHKDAFRPEKADEQGRLGRAA